MSRGVIGRGGGVGVEVGRAGAWGCSGARAGGAARSIPSHVACPGSAPLPLRPFPHRRCAQWKTFSINFARDYGKGLDAVRAGQGWLRLTTKQKNSKQRTRPTFFAMCRALGGYGVRPTTRGRGMKNWGSEHRKKVKGWEYLILNLKKTGTLKYSYCQACNPLKIRCEWLRKWRRKTKRRKSR